MPQFEEKTVDPFFAPTAPTDGGILDRPVSSWTDIGRAALEQENDIYNFGQAINRDKFPPVDGYDEVDYLKKKGLLENGERFLGSSSPAETEWKIEQVRREEENKRILDAGGVAAFGAQVLSGAVSPTTFIPFWKGATGSKAILMGAASLFAGAAAQEMVLYDNQLTRSPGEVAMSLGSSVVLGGVLGAIAHTLAKKDWDKLVSNTDTLPDKEYISAPMRMSGDLNAMEVTTLQDVGKLEGMGAAALSRLPIAQNPIIRGLQQWNAPAFVKEQGGSPVIRRFTAGFSQDDLALQKNQDWLAASPGGNVENLKKTYQVVAYKAHQAVEGAYLDYAKTSSGVMQATRARISAARQGKMSYDEFKQAIIRDIWTGFEKNAAPEVRKAAQAVETEVFNKLYKEGVEVGIYKGDEKVVGDEGYARRVYNHTAIVQRRQDFAKILADHYKMQLETEFVKANEKFVARQEADKAKLEAWTVPEEEVTKRKMELQQRLKDVQEQTDPNVLAADAADRTITRNLRALAKEKDGLLATKSNNPNEFLLRAGRIAEIDEQMKLHAKDQADLEEVLGEDLGKYRSVVREINKNLDNLKKAFVGVEGRRQAKLRKIEGLEEQQIDTILSYSAKIEKLRKFAKSASPEALGKAIKKLQDDLADAAGKYDKLEDTIVKADVENLPEVPFAAIDKQGEVGERMMKINAKLDDLENFDRASFDKALDEMKRTLGETAAELNAKRTLRAEKLWAQAEKLSPEARLARQKALETKMKDDTADFRDRWRLRGAVSDAPITMNGAVADLSEKAREDAEAVINKILGSERRLAYHDIIQAERGPELKRVLSISSDSIADFLETDIEKVIATYTRTLGADISLARVFGEMVPGQEFKALTDEKDKMLQAVKEATKKDGTPKYTPKQLIKENKKIEAFYEGARKDLYVMLERVRGIRNVPTDPEAWSYRGAKMLMDLNYLRFMGGVLISSIPDISRVVMKHGLANTMKNAVVPMITDFKTIRMSQREAQLAGTALDVLLHTRMYSMSDVFDDAHRGTSLERGVHFLASRLGVWGGFDHWNSAMKQITAGVVNARALDNIAIVMKAQKGNEKKAIEFLAKNNIDQEIAETIWKQVTNGKGGGKVNGIWLPNTEHWDMSEPGVARAQRAYRAMLAAEVDATIVTPGLGKPNWTDENTFYRMLAQFKSYGMVSTQKVMMANLQQHDAAAANGIMLSLGLGAMSYYLYAIAVGGKTEEEMRNAELDKWADEAISRSGVTAVFDQVQRVAEKLPILREYANFSGRASTRRGQGDLMEAALGPSFDLMEKAFRVIEDVDAPTKSTIHALRLMFPLQNLFYFRRILDQIEGTVPVPDRRQK
jgi:hypothetical protein